MLTLFVFVSPLSHFNQKDCAQLSMPHPKLEHLTKAQNNFQNFNLRYSNYDDVIKGGSLKWG